MAERPILFNAAMVRALLAGTKTQTRRVMPHQPPEILPGYLAKVYWPARDRHMTSDPESAAYLQFERPGDYDGMHVMRDGFGFRCPYGQPGDRLWVREAWRTADTLDSMSPSAIADKCLDAGYRKPWAPLQWESDGSKNKDWSGFGPGNGVVVGPGKLRPGIHMPRWASRITLEVTGVRVERLQDISEADALAEGAEYGFDCEGGFTLHPLGNRRHGYAHLWEEINGAGSWDLNPWVWVVEFKRAEAAA